LEFGPTGSTNRICWGIEIHAVRFVQFLAALDENVAGLLGFRICLRCDVINFRQYRLTAAIALEMPEVNGAVGEQHGLVPVEN
jgi:hypothetical protein